MRIEPKYYFYDLRHKEFIEINHKTYSKFKNEYQTKEIYPDFTKPENFVKLFELKVKKEYKETCTVAEWVTYSNIYIFDIADFLKSLIVIIKSRKYEIDELKQSIREAEWVYE